MGSDCDIKSSLFSKGLRQMIDIELKFSIELEVKNCLFLQFFLNGNPDLFQSVWLLSIPPTPASPFSLQTGNQGSP